MKTKRIWLWSFLFGMFAAGIVYYAFYSNASTPASSSTDLEVAAGSEENEDDEEEVVEEEEEPRFSNPIEEITEGMRAISLEVAYLHEGVSGFVEPNSYVDIIAFESYEDDDGTEYLHSVLKLQKAKVLAVGASHQNLEESLAYSTITVEVTPEDGVYLSLAEKHEEGLYFMLRNPDDEEIKEEEIREIYVILKEEGND